MTAAPAPAASPARPDFAPYAGGDFARDYQPGKMRRVLAAMRDAEAEGRPASDALFRAVAAHRSGEIWFSSGARRIALLGVAGGGATDAEAAADWRAKATALIEGEDA